MGSFDFLQRESQNDGEGELDDGGNADDELDERDVEVNRLSVKRGGKQGILALHRFFDATNIHTNSCIYIAAPLGNCTSIFTLCSLLVKANSNFSQSKVCLMHVPQIFA